jgi:hypothetical protein
VITDFIPNPWRSVPSPEQQNSREKTDTAMAEACLKPVEVPVFLLKKYFVEYELI